MFISEKLTPRSSHRIGAALSGPIRAMIMGASLISATQFVPHMAISAAAQSVSQPVSQPFSVSDYELRRVSSSEIRAGVQAFKKQDYDLAATYNMRALSSGLSPARKAAAYSNLCATYGALEDYVQARQACSAALKLSPDMAQAQHNLAIIENAIGTLALSEGSVPTDKKS